MIAISLALSLADPPASAAMLSDSVSFGGETRCSTAFAGDAAMPSRWIAGFWSGMQSAGARTVHRTVDLPRLVEEVRAICLARPGRSLQAATLDVYYTPSKP